MIHCELDEYVPGGHDITQTDVDVSKYIVDMHDVHIVADVQVRHGAIHRLHLLAVVRAGL